MANIAWPSNPSVGQTYTFGSITYYWTGTTWSPGTAATTLTGPTGPTGLTGATGPNLNVPSVRGLIAFNNAGTPNTKVDVTAYSCATVDANGSVTRSANLSFTIDAGLAGPAANGRDQAGAFSASQFLHFYAIAGSGQTTAGLVSTVAPTTLAGPTLPANYTSWAYLFSVRWDGSSHLVGFKQQGSYFAYGTRLNVLSNGGATTETALDLTSLVPACAVTFNLAVSYGGGTCDGSGNLNMTLGLRHTTGTDYATFTWVTSTATANASVLLPCGALEIPNIAQNVYYITTVTIGASSTVTLHMLGYRVPSGAE